jgi:hypothetical protein
MRSVKLLVACVVLPLCCIPSAKALLVVGDSGGGSTYTDGAGAGAGWDYVGNLIGSSPSSVSYVSNGWFVTANHVWTSDVVGKSEESLTLGGSTYTININSYTSITDTSGTAADLCMFRVNGFVGLPEGKAVMESTPLWNDSLRLIGNGYDNDVNTGLTWGNATPYYTQSKGSYSTLTPTVGTTVGYLAIYDGETPGSAYGQTYDSGGGVFVDDQLAGIMFSIGSYGGEDVTVVADFSVYGGQINTTSAIPEPSVLVMALVAPVSAFFIRRTFMM